MKSLRIMLVGCGAALLVAGCSGMGLQNAERMRSGGSEFSKSLHAGYIDRSKLEYDEADYGNSDKFATRANASAGGVDVQPEAINARHLPKDKVAELSAARERLVAALAGGARQKSPREAAHAQVMFDCWLEEQEENHQPEDIAYCRNGFMASMGSVEASLRPAPVAAVAPPPMRQPAMRQPAMPVRKTFVVYFPFNSAKVIPSSQEVVLSAIDAAKSMGAKQINVFGYTDTSGTPGYNMSLSSKRAGSVAKALMAGGLEGGDLKLRALGETQPAVATGQGVRMQENRRVVIEISK